VPGTVHDLAKRTDDEARAAAAELEIDYQAEAAEEYVDPGAEGGRRRS
jgi:hypothetical protein